MIMRMLLLLFAIVLLHCTVPESSDEFHSSSTTSPENKAVDSTFTPLSVFEDAFSNKKSNIQVKQQGVVIALLSDDTVGDRHQRFIVRISNNQTLLIAHNIDIGLRVPNVAKGKNLTFYGEYEWNDEGGVVHWTHDDPDGSHVGGWLEYDGVKFD